MLEALEDRFAPAAVVVTTTNDLVDNDTTSIANLIADAAVTGDTAISLREAITAANNDPTDPSDTITFAAALAGPGAGTRTFTLTGGILTIAAASNITIDGTAATPETISGGGASGIFNVSNGDSVLTINDLILRDGIGVASGVGDRIGGAITNSGTLNATDVTFTDNQAIAPAGGAAGAGGAGQGGAIHNTNTVNLTNVVFTNNLARGGDGNDDATGGFSGGEGSGGAVYTRSGTLTINGATFTGNTAQGGDGGDGTGAGTTGGDGGDAFGGAIRTDSGGTTEVNNATFTGNTTEGGDGGDGTGAAGGDGGDGSGGAIYNGDLHSLDLNNPVNGGGNNANGGAPGAGAPAGAFGAGEHDFLRNNSVITQFVVTVPPPIDVRSADVFGATVEARDANGTVVTTFGDTADDDVDVTTLVSPVGGGFTGGSTITVQASEGVAVFNNLALTRGGSYTLEFSSASVQAAAAAPATANVHVLANSLAFFTVPNKVRAGAAGNNMFTVVVEGRDSTNQAADIGADVTLDFTRQGVNTFNAGGTLTLTAGINTPQLAFNDLTLDRQGDYDVGLTASNLLVAGTLDDSAVDALEVLASRLVFTASPDVVRAGSAGGNANTFTLTVEGRDEFITAGTPNGELADIEATVNVTFTRDVDDTFVLAPGGLTFIPPHTVSQTGGGGDDTLVFSGLMIDRQGDYTVALTPAPLNNLDVDFGTLDSTATTRLEVAASTLVFTASPDVVRAGSAGGNANTFTLTVEGRDEIGEAADIEAALTLTAIRTGGGAFTFAGTNPRAADAVNPTVGATNGADTIVFNDLMIDRQGDYTINVTAVADDAEVDVFTGPGLTTPAAPVALEVAASTLVFQTQPDVVRAGSAGGNANTFNITVEGRDEVGEAADIEGTVNLTFTRALDDTFVLNPGIAALTPPHTVTLTAAGGVGAGLGDDTVTFTGLMINRQGDYTIELDNPAPANNALVDFGALNDDATKALEVAASRLVFQAQPDVVRAGSAAGNANTFTITVEGRDEVNELADIEATVTLNFARTGGGVFTLAGTTTLAADAVNPTVGATVGADTLTFPGLMIDRQGDYTITLGAPVNDAEVDVFTGPGLTTPAAPKDLEVAASRLLFTTQPDVVRAGSVGGNLNTFTLTVEGRDEIGELADIEASVTILATRTGGGAFVLAGTTTRDADAVNPTVGATVGADTLTFPGLMIDRQGDYTFSATGVNDAEVDFGTLNTTNTTPVEVAASRLVFQAAPDQARAGSAGGAANTFTITVEGRDEVNELADIEGTVNLTFTRAGVDTFTLVPGVAALTPPHTVTLTAAGGVGATVGADTLAFSGLQIDRGGDYTITLAPAATNTAPPVDFGTLNSTATKPFEILASRLVFGTVPTQAIRAGLDHDAIPANLLAELAYLNGMTADLERQLGRPAGSLAGLTGAALLREVLPENQFLVTVFGADDFGDETTERYDIDSTVTLTDLSFANPAAPLTVQFGSDADNGTPAEAAPDDDADDAVRTDNDDTVTFGDLFFRKAGVHTIRATAPGLIQRDSTPITVNAALAVFTSLPTGAKVRSSNGGADNRFTVGLMGLDYSDGAQAARFAELDSTMRAVKVSGAEHLPGHSATPSTLFNAANTASTGNAVVLNNLALNRATRGAGNGYVLGTANTDGTSLPAHTLQTILSATKIKVNAWETVFSREVPATAVRENNPIVEATPSNKLDRDSGKAIKTVQSFLDFNVRNGLQGFNQNLHALQTTVTGRDSLGDPADIDSTLSLQLRFANTNGTVTFAPGNVFQAGYLDSGPDANRHNGKTFTVGNVTSITADQVRARNLTVGRAERYLGLAVSSDPTLKTRLSGVFYVTANRLIPDAVGLAAFNRGLEGVRQFAGQTVVVGGKFRMIIPQAQGNTVIRDFRLQVESRDAQSTSNVFGAAGRFDPNLVAMIIRIDGLAANNRPATLTAQGNNRQVSPQEVRAEIDPRTGRATFNVKVNELGQGLRLTVRAVLKHGNSERLLESPVLGPIPIQSLSSGVIRPRTF